MKFKIVANSVLYLTLIFLSSCSSTKTVPTTQAIQQNTQITSFSKSKNLLLKLYKDHPVTLYCGCSFSGKKPDLSSCGYIPKKDWKRANRIEWEHVVPAHAFGQSLPEWRDGNPMCVSKKGKKYKGRRCAEKVNKQYRRMQADMYNLYPAIGEVNDRRSNYTMAIIEGEKREFGKCDVEISRKEVEPREEIRGEIARTYLYMDSVYPGRGIISKKNRKLFNTWDRSDPVDQWECERTRRIEMIQDNRNEIVIRRCKMN